MEKEDTHETKLAEVYEKLESGDISVSDAIRDSNRLTSEMAVTQARNAAGQQTQKIFNDRDAQAGYSVQFGPNDCGDALTCPGCGSGLIDPDSFRFMEDVLVPEAEDIETV